MKTITIEGQLRTEFGKSATRQLRSQELVPGVIYGGAQEVSFVAPAKAFRPLVYTPNFQLAEVKLEGKFKEGGVFDVHKFFVVRSGSLYRLIYFCDT